MRTIWKFPLKPEITSIAVPAYWMPLSIQVQGGVPCIWAQIETETSLSSKRIAIIGTGHRITGEELSGLTFLGTFQLQNGALVFHVYVEL